MTLEFEKPLTIPKYRVVAALQRHIMDQIVRQQPAVGTRMATAEELAKQFGVSLSTINRTLDTLQRNGWIERRVGQGTFIGYRARMTTMVPPEMVSGGHYPRVTRLAVAVLPLEQSSQNWHAQGLLNAIDAAASDGDVSVELLGQCNGDNNRFAKRLAQTQPDVLVLLKPVIQSAPIIREAERLNIPCILTGTRLRDMGIPVVYEDGCQGARLAVEQLLARGHRRIGFIVPNEPVHLWFDRRAGYEQAMTQAGIELDQNLIHWHAASSLKDETQKFENYMAKMRPTAIITATGCYMDTLAPLIRSKQLRIPEDLSLVTFDQSFDYFRHAFGSITPDYIELPLREMGTQVVTLARKIVSGETCPQKMALPCRYVEGATVLPLQK